MKTNFFLSPSSFSPSTLFFVCCKCLGKQLKTIYTIVAFFPCLLPPHLTFCVPRRCLFHLSSMKHLRNCTFFAAIVIRWTHTHGDLAALDVKARKKREYSQEIISPEFVWFLRLPVWSFDSNEPHVNVTQKGRIEKPHRKSMNINLKFHREAIEIKSKWNFAFFLFTRAASPAEFTQRDHSADEARELKNWSHLEMRW